MQGAPELLGQDDLIVDDALVQQTDGGDVGQRPRDGEVVVAEPLGPDG